MTPTSKALKRLGVAGIAVATIGAGIPVFFATSASAAVGAPTSLTPNDCPSPTATTTTASSACTTQAQVGTIKTLSFTETDANGNPTPNRTIDFTFATAAPAGAPGGQTTGQGSATFPAGQPDNRTQADSSGKSASCTTDANGVCSVNVTDDQPDLVQVNAVDRLQPGAKATENVQFRPTSVAPYNLDDSARIEVAPATEGNKSGAPTPGRPEQVTYTVSDKSGNIVRGQSVTLSVDQAAFFTPNCTPTDANGDPQRFPAGSVDANGNSNAGQLMPPVYDSCTFDPKPADGAKAGNLKSLGNTITVVTDQNGQATVTVADNRDQAYDNAGVVSVVTTAVAAGSTSAFDTSGSNSNGNASPIVFTTRVSGGPAVNKFGPLNGSSIHITQVGKTPEGQQTLTDSGTVNIGDKQQRVFTVLLTDQFGNLTQTNPSGSTNATERGAAYLTKTGAGEIGRFVACGVGAQGPCYNRGTTTQNTNGSTTQVFALKGGYTNDNNDVFVTDANGVNSGTTEDGVQTLVAKWNAQLSTFVFTTGKNATLDSVDQTKYETKTSTASINYYKVQPTDITFKTTPSNSVPAGTVVTVTATVKDQFGNAVSGYPVSFFRTGNSNNCTGTATNGTGNGQNFGQNTGPNGSAGFSFSCSDPSTQNVTVVVSDNNGNELARNTQVVTFTGAAQSQSPSPSASATSTTSTSPSPSASSSTGTTSPSPTSSTNPPVTRQRLTLSTSTTDIQPNQQGILTATGTQGFNVTLRCYSRPDTTYFDARPQISNANGTVTFRILPGTNTRCFVKYADKADNDSTSSESVVINVHTTLSLSTVRTAGLTYTFQGRNLPRRAGQLITLYRVDNNGNEIRTSNLKTDASGIYRVSRHFTGRGTFKFLVRTSQTLTNAPGVSNVITVTVR